MVSLNINSSPKFKNIDEILSYFSQSSDFNCLIISECLSLKIAYFNTLVDEKIIQEHVSNPILKNLRDISNLEDIKKIIPIKDIKVSTNVQEISEKILQGSAFIFINKAQGIIVNSLTIATGYREQNDAENEYSVIGPKVGFVENIDTNLRLLRKSLNTPNLKFEETFVGTTSNTRVVIAYLEGIMNPEHLNTARQRIKDLDYDLICDSSLLDQLITDHSSTPFPLLLTTERVDRAAYCLINGQLAILCDGSPYVINAPTSIFDFFVSPEDYLLPWVLGSFFRLIRFLGVLFSISATPIYVAVLTFHIAIIPKDMLGPIIDSRVNVPFPPLIEALFLEVIIELLREAGARLPTKVGQTLGIVGGIVIGQAAVEAALTSNILLIIVALSALASFTTPTFKMSNTIRFLRFPLIILASIWGGLGLVAGIIILYTHTLRLKSFGMPYLAPLYPFRYAEFTDGFIRFSLPYIRKRRELFRPLLKSRFKVNGRNKDIGDDFNNE
ncbi:spore gernimation protein GerA [Bacillus sp. SA1-12]|uniref:spore germination protein n=1 Tax=Bacillus sp. SA1-12 TaxID=1455638 RepID=UPI0006272073|nr:spore germination protein [Bacillus sp. SA1-12]KKI91174.1 spore gernimation protein GerA [Bacillus sp. SA1-12]